MQKRYKEIKTWFPLYSSKYLWIIFPLFACLRGKHLASTSPRNPTQSKFLVQQRSLPLEKCSGFANGCWWPDSAFATINGHCWVSQAGRWGGNGSHFTVTCISGLRLLPQNTQCLITLESPFASRFSENILPPPTEGWPGDPWELWYLSAEWGN